MKLRNPNFADPRTSRLATLQATLQAHVATIAANVEMVTFDTLRRVPGLADATDGELDHVARALGFEVEDE